MRNLLLATVSIAIIPMLPAAGAMAQDVAAPAQEAEGDDAAAQQSQSTNTILVTALKRSETLLEVPLAVSVISGDDLEQRNATGFADYITSVPGVQFNPAGNAFGNSISIRGVSDGTSSFLTQQPVALYLDETPLTLSQGAVNLDYTVFGIDQILVVKGPNSTLYGASSLGGTIKVTTQRPSLDEFTVRGRSVVSFTEDGGTNFLAAGSVSGPLVQDVIGFELTGYYDREGGYVDDPSRGVSNINSGDTYGGRLAFRIEPSDNLTIDLTGYYQKSEFDGFGTVSLAGLQEYDSIPLAVDQPQEDEFLLFSAVINYDFGFAELTSATSYFDRETFISSDFTNTFFNPGIPGAPIDTVTSDVTASAQFFSQELRLASAGDGPINWLIGGLYSREEYDEVIEFNDPVFGPIFNPDLRYLYDTYAVFGEIGYDITPALNLTVGGRYTEYDNPIDFNSVGLFVAPGTETLQVAASENDFSPRIALNYEYDDGSVYIQASRGFRLGQVNVPLVALPTENIPVAFGSDSLWNYEIGAKTSWLDGDLIANVAVYYIDWTDIQLTRTAATGFTFIDNIGSAGIFGVELETTAYLSPTTTWTGSIGYINGELKEDVPGIALDGTRLPGSPEFTAATSLQQEFNIGDNDGFARIDYLYYGAYDNQFVFAGTPRENGDYSKLDLRAGMTFGPVEATVFVTNLTNSRPILTRTDVPGGQVTTLQPRTVGASVGFRF